jgi:hypothetical protein
MKIRTRVSNGEFGSEILWVAGTGFVAGVVLSRCTCGGGGVILAGSSCSDKLQVFVPNN